MLRQFAAAWLVFLLGAGLHQYLVRKHPVAGGILMALALLVGAPGIFFPGWVRWPFVVATLAAFPIGWVVSQMVLALMFFAVLTPVALLMRMCGRDPLRRRARPDTQSCWVRKDAPADPKRYLRQY